MATNDDDQRRVELTPKQIRLLEERLDIHRSEHSTPEQAADAAGEVVGIVRSALWRRS